jgi:hypothetical protein
MGGPLIYYSPDTIPAGSLRGGSVLVAGERNVPAYRPLTRAEDTAPLAVGGPPPVAALAPAPPPVEVGLPAIAMPQDPHPRRDRGRGRSDIRGGR